MKETYPPLPLSFKKERGRGEEEYRPSFYLKRGAFL